MSDEEAKAHEARFLALISGLSSSGMQYLGKVVNPLTGNIERNLDAAQDTIDFLRMLREKTKGNLSVHEERTLNSLLGTLQLNSVDELKAEAEKPKEQTQEEKPTDQKETTEGRPREEKEEQPPSETEAPTERKQEAASEAKDATGTPQPGQPPEEKAGKGKKSKKGKEATR